MQKSKQEKINLFLTRLNDHIDIGCQINRETERCNHYYVTKTLRPSYENSKKLLSESLEELLDINSES